jgi:hypothetical protein
MRITVSSLTVVRPKLPMPMRRWPLLRNTSRLGWSITVADPIDTGRR